MTKRGTRDRVRLALGVSLQERSTCSLWGWCAQSRGTVSRAESGGDRVLHMCYQFLKGPLAAARGGGSFLIALESDTSRAILAE